MLPFASAAGLVAQPVVAFASEAGGGEGGGLTINLFWIIVSALNFLVFLAVISLVVLRPVGRMLSERRVRIEQGF